MVRLTSKATRAWLAALLMMGAVPETARAGGLGFRNDLKGPVIVQNSAINRNVVVRGKPYVVHPGKSIIDQVPLGNIIITIHDANQPSRLLFPSPTIILETGVRQPMVEDAAFRHRMEVGVGFYLDAHGTSQ